MQVFKAACKVLAKHRVYLIVYVLWLSLMGVFMALSVAEDNPQEAGFDAYEADYAFIDRDGSELSQGLASFLETQGQAVEVVDDPYALQDAVAKGRVDCMLIVPQGYGDAFETAVHAGEQLPSIQTVFSYSSTDGTMINQQVQEYLSAAAGFAGLEPELTQAQVVKRANDAMRTTVEVTTESTGAAEQTLDSFTFYEQWSTYPYLGAIIVCIGLLMERFNKHALRRRNGAAPITPLAQNVQIAGACLVLSLGIWLFVNALGLVVFGESAFALGPQAVAMHLLATLVFITVPASIGFLVGQVGMGEFGANAVGNVCGLLFSFLGGLWISIGFLPAEVQSIVNFIPTYWFVQATNQIASVASGFGGMSSYAADLGMVLLFSLAVLAVGLVAGRVRASKHLSR